MLIHKYINNNNKAAKCDTEDLQAVPTQILFRKFILVQDVDVLRL